MPATLCSPAEEKLLWTQGASTHAGVDEAGRGCLAGPVVAAAVILHPEAELTGLNDSKKLSARVRNEIFVRLQSDPLIRIAVARVEADQIDRMNILEAARLAMRKAVLALPELPEYALIDGLPVPDFPVPSTAIVKGDARATSIAAASIVAKVTRDRLMVAFDAEFPQYGFAAHKGYATAAHRASLARHGPCPIHRLTFAPVAQMELALVEASRVGECAAH